MNQKYDVVIPVGPNDVDFVYRVVDYVWRCLIEAEHIYILTNIKYFPIIQRRLPNEVPVTLLDENKLLEGVSFGNVKAMLDKYVPGTREIRPGWYFQQFLKFAFALSPYAKEYYVTWDADTLPLATIRYFSGEKLLYCPKREYNYNYFRTLEKLLGYGRQVDFSFIAENMIFSVDIVKEMLTAIEKRAVKGMDWMEFIISCCDFKDPLPAFSEFETYGNYCVVNHPEAYQPRYLNTFREAGFIAGRGITEEKLRMLSFDLDTASFERFHIPPFSYGLDLRLLLWKTRFQKIKKMSFGEFLTKINDKITGKRSADNIAVDEVIYRLPAKRLDCLESRVGGGK